MQNKEKHSQAAILGLQHLLAMYSGSILVPIMIASCVVWQPSSNFNSINTSVLVFQLCLELPSNQWLHSL